MELAAFEACVDVCEDEASFFLSNKQAIFLTVVSFVLKL